MKPLKCEKCNYRLFKVREGLTCRSCQDNWIWNDELEEYVQPSSKKDFDEAETREVVTNGECHKGQSWNHGCILVHCAKCNNLVKHIPLLFE